MIKDTLEENMEAIYRIYHGWNVILNTNFKNDEAKRYKARKFAAQIKLSKIFRCI